MVRAVKRVKVHRDRFYRKWFRPKWANKRIPAEYATILCGWRFEGVPLGSSVAKQERAVNTLEKYQPRPVLALKGIEKHGWHLKRYAILAEGKMFDETVVSAASQEALNRLPKAGSLHDEQGNQGVAFQIIHFANVAVVSPVFYWQWASVLARLDQMRASWQTPTHFQDGAKEVVGCIWEMNIVRFEVETWATQMLGGSKSAKDSLPAYLQAFAPSGPDV